MQYAEIGGSRSGFFTVGVASLQVAGVNLLRKKLVLANDSANIIYLVKGTAAAVVGSGIRLNANGGTVVFEPDTYGRIWRGSIQVIATGAASNLVWQEDW